MQPDIQMEVCVNVTIRNQSSMGGGLDLRQTFTMPGCDFAVTAEIMSRFHELMKTIENERAK